MKMQAISEKVKRLSIDGYPHAPADDPYLYGRGHGPYKNPAEEIAAELCAELGIELLGEHTHHLPATLTQHEVMEMLDGGQRRSARDYLVVRLLYTTGMRPSELCGFCPADINPIEKFIFIRGGKDDRDRYVLTDDETFGLLVEWQGDKPMDETMFALSERQLQNIVNACAPKKLRKKYEAMGRRFSPYCLRHSFATHAYQQGCDLFTLQVLMGHQYLETTRIYTECSLKHSKQVYHRLDLLQRG
jgi:site-specific recombinase XerD